MGAVRGTKACTAGTACQAWPFHALPCSYCAAARLQCHGPRHACCVNAEARSGAATELQAGGYD